jgi:hypothetical protein
MYPYFFRNMLMKLHYKRYTFMRSENSSRLICIYYYGKFSLQLGDVFRNASLACNATSLTVLY